MAEERQTMEVGIGQAGEPPVGVEIKDGQKRQRSEVGGRFRRYTTVVCPHCDMPNDIIEETTEQLWFRCWNCRELFYY